MKRLLLSGMRDLSPTDDRFFMRIVYISRSTIIGNCSLPDFPVYDFNVPVMYDIIIGKFWEVLFYKKIARTRKT